MLWWRILVDSNFDSSKKKFLPKFSYTKNGVLNTLKGSSLIIVRTRFKIESARARSMGIKIELNFYPVFGLGLKVKYLYMNNMEKRRKLSR